MVGRRVKSERLWSSFARNMRSRWWMMLLMAANGVWAPLGAAIADSLTADQIMLKNFYGTKFSTLKGEVNILLQDKAGHESTRRMSVWSMLKPNGVDSVVLMRFKAPADYSGMAFLKIENLKADDTVWVYLPTLRNTRRLGAGSKRDSFFGTDFENGDILLPPVDLYKTSLIKYEPLDGDACAVLEALPVSDAVRDLYGYSKKKLWISTSSFVERKVEFYGLDGRLQKTEYTSDIKQIDPSHRQWLALKRQMINETTGHKTSYEMSNASMDPSMTESLFSPIRLDRP